MPFNVAKTQKGNKNESLIESYEIIENAKAQHKEKKIIGNVIISSITLTALSAIKLEP